VRVTHDAASASAAGSVRRGSGREASWHVRTHARHGTTGRDAPRFSASLRFHSTKCGRPAAGRELWRRKRSGPGRESARTYQHRRAGGRDGRGGATSLSAAVPPASGRRPSAFPKPQRPQVCCSHLRRPHCTGRRCSGTSRASGGSSWTEPD
jgi:hypothetical protein